MHLFCTFEQGTNIILSHSKNLYLSRLPNPRVFSKKKRNQSLPLFGVVFKLSQVPSVGKEEKEKERVRAHFLLLLQPFALNWKLAVCADVLTCGGPQLCWRGPLRWRRRRLRCEPSVRPERSRPTPLSLQGSLLLTHIQTFHLLVELRQVCSSRLTSNGATRPKSFSLSTQHPAGWILSVPLLMISSAFFCIIWVDSSTPAVDNQPPIVLLTAVKLLHYEKITVFAEETPHFPGCSFGAYSFLFPCLSPFIIFEGPGQIQQLLCKFRLLVLRTCSGSSVNVSQRLLIYLFKKGKIKMKWPMV